MKIREKAEAAQRALEKARKQYEAVAEPTVDLSDGVSVKQYRDGTLELTDFETDEKVMLNVDEVRMLITRLKIWGVIK